MTSLPFWGLKSSSDAATSGKAHYWYRLVMPQKGVHWGAECGIEARFIRPDAGHEKCKKCERLLAVRRATSARGA
jgi:hypothetical protein